MCDQALEIISKDDFGRAERTNAYAIKEWLLLFNRAPWIVDGPDESVRCEASEQK